MKKILVSLLLIGAVFLQLSLTAHSTALVPAVNLAFVAVVLTSSFTEGSQSLWLALLAGLVLDYFSLSEFGVNTAFLVIIALLTKTLLNLGRSASKLSYGVSIVALGTVFYNLLLLVNLVIRDDIITYNLLVRQIALETGVNMVTFLLAYGCISFIRGRGTTSTEQLSFVHKKNSL